MAHTRDDGLALSCIGGICAVCMYMCVCGVGMYVQYSRKSKEDSVTNDRDWGIGVSSSSYSLAWRSQKKVVLQWRHQLQLKMQRHPSSVSVRILLVQVLS